MTSGFHSNELLKASSNYPVAKGDVQGHPFHGNQYTSFGDRAHGVFSDVMTGKMDPISAAEQHSQLAKDHSDAAEKARAEGNAQLESLHRNASDLHQRAARSAGDFADDSMNDEYPADETHIYFSDASDAARASEAADNAAK
jgi:hypothetical protein